MSERRLTRSSLSPLINTKWPTRFARDWPSPSVILTSEQSMTGASKIQVSHPSRLPASAAKSMSKSPTIVDATKKTTITRQGGKACKKQKHQANKKKILPAQTTKKCSKKIPVVPRLSCNGEPRYAVTAIINSPEQPASSVTSASTTSPSLHPASSVPLSTSSHEVTMNRQCFWRYLRSDQS